MAERFGRRRFVNSVGAASMLGALGIPMMSRAASQAGGPAQAPPSLPEFAVPATLRKGAQLDSRFPVSFATPVTEGFRLVTEYFTALSQRNLDALARTLHFPFAIYEDVEPIVVPTAADLLKSPPPSLNATGRGKTKLLRGSYDLLESANVHLYCPVGGVFSLSFTRYTPNGHRLLVCDGIY